MNMRNILGIIVVIALAIGSISGIAGVAVAAPPGSISGTVYQAGGTTPIDGSAILTAYDTTDNTLAATAYSSGYDGTYTIPGLDPGSYLVLARADGYSSEYYLNVSITDPGSATPVPVTTSDVPGIDFHLTPGGFISGSVVSDNGTPIYSGHIMAFADNVTHDLVDETWMSSTSNNYRIGKDLPAGSYLVRVEAEGYFSQYYDNVTDIGSATPVAVTVPNETSGIDFTLTPGGSISGSVYELDGTTPIYGAHVMAFDNVTHDLVDEVWMSSTSNSYTLGHDMPSGSYLVRAEATGYFSQYYDNATDIGSATPVSVTIPDETSGINFNLNDEALHISTVSASNIAATSATITWTTDQPANSKVEYGLDTNYGSSTTLDPTLVTDHSVNLTGLTSQTTYHYKVDSVDGFSNADSSGDYTFTTPDVTAPVISAVSTTSITGTGATITWTTDEPASSQVVYGLDTNYGSSSTLDPTLVTGHSVNLTGLTSQTTYHYKVESADAAGNPASSADYTFTTLDVTAPVISAVSATSITATGATITWTTDEAASSQVEYGLTTSYGSSTTLDPALVTGHSVNLTGLTSQTTYHYRVDSVDAAGNPASSVDYTFTTLDVTAPVISAVSATSITDSGATITWTTDEAASSQVEYGLTTSYGSITTLDPALVTGHSVNLTGLSSFKTYHYKVDSVDAAGNPASSVDYTFTTTDVTAPTTPVVSDDGASTTDLTQLHASWTSSDAESGVTEYQYAIGTTSGGTDVLDWTSVGTDTEVTKTGLSLSAGTTYYFAVKAKNGQGLWSVVGTSDGIIAQETTSGGGMPVWGWVLIGLAGVAVVGGLGYFAFMRLGQQQ